MKGVIIVKGKYGATRQYAEWLQNELSLPLILSDDCTREEIDQNDLIIIGSSIYIGKLLISKWLKDNCHSLQNKKIFLFVVSGTPANEIQKLQAYVEASVPAEILHQCRVYFLQGRLIHKNLSLLDKFMLRVGAMISKEPGAKEKMLTDYDAVKKENLGGLIDDIEKLVPAEVKVELTHY